MTRILSSLRARMGRPLLSCAAGLMLTFSSSAGVAAEPASVAIDGHVGVHVQSGVETSGKPGAPDATTTIDGNYIPNAAQPFGGEIQLNADRSKPFWPARVVPPKGAPNILLIMTDDTGFGAASTFGGVIPTPALDQLAKEGLRYTNLTSTLLRSARLLARRS
jgi:hypothetical protein